jgi:hypothetical protein
MSQNDEDAEMMVPTLSRLHAGHPAISLHEDDVVYIMAKVEHRDHEAWMPAIDMRKKTLKVVRSVKPRLEQLGRSISVHNW